MNILIVEDNEKLADLLQRAMEEEGHRVDIITDGERALARLADVGYELIVLDWMLPTLDGISVCKELRSQGVSTPILMLSARGDVSERILGLDAGADDYLPKPFDLEELFARIRALGRNRVSCESVVRVGPLALDRLEHRATLNGASIDLTPREFALLTYLARAAGRTVPRTELLIKVWEMTHDPGSNVVDAHIKKVREKLGQLAGLIETVRGVGYRLGMARAAA